MMYHRKKPMQRYPKYEPVHFDYVHELPAGWQITPNIAIFERKVDRGHPNEDLLSVSSYKGIVKQSEIEARKDRSSVDKSQYQLVEPGEIAYNPMLMWSGAIGYSAYRGIVSPDYAVIKPKIPINPKYFHYQFRSDFYRNYCKQFSYGIVDSRLRLYYKYFKRMYAIVPPLDVQDAIVAYLDRKSERANDFIAKQTRLIEALKEQKQAVMNQAVTKGLNPDAPLKESGIEWIGKIPAHWEILPIKRLFQVELGKMLNQAAQTKSDIIKPYLRAANIKWEGVDVENASVNRMGFTSSQLNRYRLRQGDLLVTEGGATVGRSAIWKGELDECYYQNSLNRLRPKGEQMIKFAYYWMYFLTKSGYIDTIIDKATFGHLTQEKLQVLPITTMPYDEQVAIVQALDTKLVQIDRAIAKAETQMALARDYLHSLTFQVVTGQRAVPSATIAQRTQA